MDRRQDVAATFTRPGAVGPLVGRDGVIRQASVNRLRTTWLNGAPYMLLEAARTNLVTSDNFDSGWTSAGSPVITSGVDDPGGGTGAYTIADDDGAAVEGKYLPVTFGADGTQALAFIVRGNTMPGSGVQSLYLRDSTAGVTRGLLEIASWSDGEPSVTAAVGTFLGQIYIGNGYWLLLLRATGTIAANTNRVTIEPASTAGQTGSIDVFRAGAFDPDVPGLPLLDASDARNDETFHVPWPHGVISFSAYFKFLELGSVDLTAGIFHIGSSSASGDPRVLLNSNGSVYVGQHDNGSSVVSSTLAAAPTITQAHELLLTFDAITGQVQVSQSIAGAAVTTAAASAAAAPGAGWASEADELPRLYVNSLGASSRGLNAYRWIKFARGSSRTIPEMREVFA